MLAVEPLVLRLGPGEAALGHRDMVERAGVRMLGMDLRLLVLRVRERSLGRRPLLAAGDRGAASTRRLTLGKRIP